MSVGCKSHTPRPGEYYDKEERFSIIPPAGWEQQQGVMAAAVVFLSPMEHADDGFRENINVVVEKLPSDLDFDEYVAASKANMRKLLTDFEELESSRRTVNGMIGERLIYAHRMGQVKCRVLLYIFVENGRGYNVTCTAGPDTFDEYLPDFEKACESFMAH